MLTLFLIGIGIGALLFGSSGAKLLGACFLIAGMYPLALHIHALSADIHRRGLARRAAMRRSALQASRRERAERLRDRRQVQLETRKSAALKLARLRGERQEKARVEQERKRAHDRNFEERFAAEVFHIQSLSDSELRSEVAAIFGMRGLHPQIGKDDAACDLLLRCSAGTGIEVARFAPTDRIVSRADIMALEEWRSATYASRAYLISVKGFAPSAVRDVDARFITLVEAHLLAAWKLADAVSMDAHL